MTVNAYRFPFSVSSEGTNKSILINDMEKCDTEKSKLIYLDSLKWLAAILDMRLCTCYSVDAIFPNIVPSNEKI